MNDIIINSGNLMEGINKLRDYKMIEVSRYVALKRKIKRGNIEWVKRTLFKHYIDKIIYCNSNEDLECNWIIAVVYRKYNLNREIGKIHRKQLHKSLR